MDASQGHTGLRSAIHGLIGLALCLAANVIITMALVAATALPSGFGFGVGVYQLVYVVPAAMWLRRQGMSAMRTGVLVGAAITFLFSAVILGGGYFGFLAA
jgi:hypothetical protein